MPTLELTPLERALAALQRGLLRWQATPSDEELRDACIQRFEVTFELSWKMLKRRLELDLPNAAEVDGMSYRELMRVDLALPGRPTALTLATLRADLDESDLRWRVDQSLFDELPADPARAGVATRRAADRLSGAPMHLLQDLPANMKLFLAGGKS